jgi:phosphoglycolate phosphatase
MDLTEMERVDETVPVDGADACLAALEARGMRVGVLTRGSRPYAMAALRCAGLDGRFDAMVCRDDHPEEEAKPNGKAMRRIASLLDVPPERCLVVGDHLMDLTCARSVSAGFVGVLTGSFKSPDWRANGDPAVIDSVAGLPRFLGIDKA